MFAKNICFVTPVSTVSSSLTEEDTSKAYRHL